jgi:uncharacterized protein (DUF2141 family)
MGMPDDSAPGGSPAGFSSQIVTTLENRSTCSNATGELAAAESSDSDCNSTEFVLVEVTQEVQCPFLGTGPDVCERGTLNISVSGVRNNDGHVRFVLFASEGAWKSDSRYRGEQAETVVTTGAAAGTMVVSFEWLLHSEYAVIAHHDKDEDGKLDTNWFGYPKEATAASEGASGGPFGGPRWRDAKFTFADPFVSKSLDMWYP